MKFCKDCKKQLNELRDLTPRQLLLLKKIIKHFEKNECSPTISELAEALGGKRLSTVHEHLEALKKKGYITRVYQQPRSIKLNSEEKTWENTRLEAVQAWYEDRLKEGPEKF